MTNDRPMLGITLMTGFCILAPLGDSIAKLLGGEIPLSELLIVRFTMQVLLLVPVVWWFKYRLTMTKRIFYLVLIRTILHIIGIGGMFSALRFLPLADTIAIAFVMPLIMLILGHYVLKEEVGARRIIASAIGFVGTLLVVQPSFEAVGLPALLPLLVAVVFALFMLVTRQIAKEIEPIALQVVSGIQAVIILCLIFPFTIGLGIETIGFKIPSAFDGLLLFTLGVIGTLAHLLMTWALRFAPSATLAPMQYLEIPFATLIGWFIFKDLPNGLAALGILITIAAGLYIIWRERMVTNNSANRKVS
ncbi:MAG: DMT family transporter [Rhizobiaceae bacterium]